MIEWGSVGLARANDPDENGPGALDERVFVWRVKKEDLVLFIPYFFDFNVFYKFYGVIIEIL